MDAKITPKSPNLDSAHHGLDRFSGLTASFLAAFSGHVRVLKQLPISQKDAWIWDDKTTQ